MKNIGSKLVAQNQQTVLRKLNLYQHYPEEDLTFENFYKIGIKRVKFLRDIETLEERTSDSFQTSKEIMSKAKDCGLNYEYIPDDQAYKQDELSHFIGRLGYCKTEALQQWFVKQEARLFKARLQSQNISAYKEILTQFGIEFQKVDSKFWEQFSTGILEGNGLSGNIQNEVRKFYKIRFENALELVSRLECYVHDGYAYIFEEKLKKILVRHYKNYLMKNLKLCKQFLNSIIENDERIGPIINMMTEVYYGNEYNTKFMTHKKGTLNLSDLEFIYLRSFPPCMVNLMQHLKELHHLKHFGRLQLGLFLKGAGLSLQDSLKFWKTEFTKKIGPESFEKNYAYNIKHNYGQIGKKCDYTPKSCLTIMKEKPGETEHHGCPFAVFNQQHLKRLLIKIGLTEAKHKEELSDILMKTKNQQAQAACRKTFLALHQDCQTENVGQHPNSYFEESMKFYSVDSKGKPSEKMKIEEEPKKP